MPLQRVQQTVHTVRLEDLTVARGGPNGWNFTGAYYHVV
jgi:hypothetical protein